MNSLNFNKLKRWEGLLALIFVLVIIANVSLSPYFIGVENIVNVFQLSVEKIMIGLIMTLVIISGEIDLSVAAVMGMCATIFGCLYQNGVPLPLVGIVKSAVGMLCGAFDWMSVGLF